jgi:hypothetical protein
MRCAVVAHLGTPLAVHIIGQPRREHAKRSGFSTSGPNRFRIAMESRESSRFSGPNRVIRAPSAGALLAVMAAKISVNSGTRRMETAVRRALVALDRCPKPKHGGRWCAMARIGCAMDRSGCDPVQGGEAARLQKDIRGRSCDLPRISVRNLLESDQMRVGY